MMNEEHKRKIGEAHKGRKLSPEHIQKLRGIKRSKEWITKQRESHKGKKLSKEHRKKIRNSLIGNKRSLGRIVSEETRKKLSEVHKGKINPGMFKKGHPPVKWWLGKKRSEETKRKVSKANKGNKSRLGQHLSEETKRKISIANKGYNHYNWRGGLSFETYTTDWTESLRRSIRERDHYTCQLCSKQQGDTAFDVHHIDYDKKNCNPENLITLCRKCHLKTNKNRGNWTKYFKKIEGGIKK